MLWPVLFQSEFVSNTIVESEMYATNGSGRHINNWSSDVNKREVIFAELTIILRRLAM